VEGLSFATRVWLAAAALAHWVTAVLVGIALLRVLRGATSSGSFTDRLRGALKLAGVALIAGCIAWQVLGGIGEARASDEAFRISGWTAMDLDHTPAPGEFPADAGLPRPGFGPDIDLTPAWTGLGLLAASAAAAYHGRSRTEDAEGGRPSTE
jgi:hypothetical protein